MLFADSGGMDPGSAWVYRAVARNLAALERLGAPFYRDHAGRIAGPLGCGSFGCVFLLEDGRVLKITSDDAEGPCSYEIMLLQRDRATFGPRGFPVVRVTALIDAVARLPSKMRVDGYMMTIYAVVREQVGPSGFMVPKAFSVAADRYTDGWDYYCNSDSSGGRIIGAALARAGLKRIRQSGLFGSRMGNFLDFMWRRGRPLMDPHSGNLARRLDDNIAGGVKGDVVLFDFGSSEDCQVECSFPRGVGAAGATAVVSSEDLARMIPVLGGSDA